MNFEQQDPAPTQALQGPHPLLCPEESEFKIHQLGRGGKF